MKLGISSAPAQSALPMRHHRMWTKSHDVGALRVFAYSVACGRTKNAIIHDNNGPNALTQTVQI